MSAINGKFFIKEVVGLNGVPWLRLAFSASGEAIDSTSYAALIADRLNGSLSVNVALQNGRLAVYISSVDEERADANPAQYLVGVVARGDASAFTEDERTDFERRVDRAFFEAICATDVQRVFGMATGIGAPLYGAPPQVGGGAHKSRRAFPWRHTVMACGVILAIGFGVAFVKSRSQPDQSDPALMAALEGGPYSGVSAKIRSQIASAGNKGNPNVNFNGQNVAIETLKAMGLEPGKANTGCLVGVK